METKIVNFVAQDYSSGVSAIFAEEDGTEFRVPVVGWGLRQRGGYDQVVGMIWSSGRAQLKFVDDVGAVKFVGYKREDGDERRQ